MHGERNRVVVVRILRHKTEVKRHAARDVLPPEDEAAEAPLTMELKAEPREGEPEGERVKVIEKRLGDESRKPLSVPHDLTENFRRVRDHVLIDFPAAGSEP